MNPFDLIHKSRYRGSPFSVWCPHCGSVSTYNEEKLQTCQAHQSMVAIDYGGAEPDTSQGTVFGHCQCTNEECQEYTHFVGNYKVLADPHESPTGYYQHFQITYFCPPVPLIQIPSGTPEKIVEIVKRSFAPAFFDQSASGHLLRYAIEELLTLLGVRRFIISKKRRKIRLSLHARLDYLPPELQSYKDRLVAIKWIGNAATHEDLTVKNLKLLYEIVAHLLEALYGTRERELLKAIKRVVRRKGL